jgi:hypothetical protein
MSHNAVDSLTQHAMLVVWGQFAQSIGLVQAVEAIPLHQKGVSHRPQTKVLEFFVAILAGLEHLKDLSRSAHPIDQDQAVAIAWRQPAWADYSGVSRSLAALTQEEAEQIAAVLDQITQPILAAEVMHALQHNGRLVYDGDLTGRPVSNSSTTYPNVAYGHLGDALHLGYQAALVSMHSPTYGRLWLSVSAHPGDTVSCTQAEAIILAAEAKTGLRPWRRTDLLGQRLRAVTKERQIREERWLASQQALTTTQARESATRQQIDVQRALVTQLETQYREKQRPERPYSALAKARHKAKSLERGLSRLAKKLSGLSKQLAVRQRVLICCQAQEQLLQWRLEQFEAENQANRSPIEAEFRLDAGFGTRENVALLIEMGYEVYIKPYSDWLTPRLKRWTGDRHDWAAVGSNAEMVVWQAMALADFPYPLDVALQRFHTGEAERYATLLHFGKHAVTTDLPGWFQHYNGRQTIEAGIKEGKGVFEMHHLKVRSAPGLCLQEQFAVFAANFVRWAAHWLAMQCRQLPAGWRNAAQPKVKEQVKVAAHTSAWVSWQEQGCLLMFTHHSVFAGRSLQVERQWAIQLPLPFSENAHFGRL